MTQSPDGSSTRYSIRSTPSPSPSSAVRVTRTGVVTSPFSSGSGDRLAVVVGASVSGSTTVKANVATSLVFPAVSVARYSTVWSPAASTAKGAE